MQIERQAGARLAPIELRERDESREPSFLYQATNGKENTMRAVTVTEYGATPAVAEIPTPEPGPGQVLIKLRAAGMNPMDSMLASGAWKPMPATFPMVLGADGAGVVEQLGEGASRFSVGDDLFGQLLIAPLGSAGTYAEYVAVTEDAPLARVPSGLDDVVAAALPTAGGAGLVLGGLARAARRQDGADRGCGRRRWLVRHSVRRERRGECHRKRARPRCGADARIRRDRDDRSHSGLAARRGTTSAPGRHRCPHRPRGRTPPALPRSRRW